MTVFKVFYKGNYKKFAFSRDQALAWIAQEVAAGGGVWEDYEILDGSEAA